MEKVLEVLAANKARQDRDRQLNIRAGEQLFPVLDRAELTAWMTEKAAGARRMAEIANPEALRLPALDEALIETVIRENPDEIECLGVVRPVVYAKGVAPKIRLEGEAVAENRWLVLPDEGVCLPSGRAVEVEISFGYYATFRSANIPELKEKVRNHLNQQQWDNWPQADRPEILIPDLVDEEAVIPEIITCQYGLCVVTGEPLLAYGTVAPKGSRYSSTDPYFEVKWRQKREEVEEYRAKAVETLEKERTVAQKRRELEIAKQEAQAVGTRFNSLFNENYYSSWSELPAELRNRIYGRHNSYLPSSPPEIRQWQAETEALIAEVEPALAEIQQQKEEAEQKAREEQEAAVRAEEARRVREEEAHRGQMEEILSAMRSILGYMPEINGGYDEVAGRNGTYLENWGRLSNVNCNAEPTSCCDGRDAVVVRAIEIASGMLEFLVYYKYGYWNLAARWRELTEDEVARIAESEVIPDPAEYIDDSGVVNLAAAKELLRAKFGKN